MIKSEIKPALDALKKIKMPKIEDKALRNLLIKDHLALLAAGRKAETKLEDARKATFAPYEDDIDKIDELNRKYNSAATDAERREINREINSHEGYFKAMKEYQKLIDQVNHEKIKGLEKIDSQKFIEEISKQDFDLGMIEALYPLFILDEEPVTEKKHDKKAK